jgi:murein DD-endopeptidase MepM/ murein hydrolase activator NlpD
VATGSAGRGSGYAFPVRGPHGTRGAIGEFGAPRNGGRTHEGFDITAACGTPLVSAHGGRVLKRAYEGDLKGNYLLVHDRGTPRNFIYAHLLKWPLPRPGESLETGQRIGAVGKTGNARTTVCHLHFEIRIHGHPVDPEPALRRWDRSS